MLAKTYEYFYYALIHHDINLTSDNLYGILVDPSYVFTHSHTKYSDVSSSEIANGYGYVTGGNPMTGITFSHSNGSAYVSWNSISWTAVGGDIPGANGFIIYDDTATNDLLVCYIPFGETRVTYHGGKTIISGIKLEFRNES